MENKDSVPARGMLLIANGSLLDPNFKRTVILLAEHGEKGSYGLILNRSTDTLLSDAFSDNELLRDSPERLHFGGPCEPNRVQVLHNCDAADLKSYRICEGVYMGGDIDMLLRMKAEAGDDLQCRFFSGYAGWAEGQLDGEMEGKSWILHPAAAGHVFHQPGSELWSALLSSMGDYYALVARMPGDPRSN